MSSESPSLERSIYIDAPPEVVFPFFTDPERMIRWCSEDAELLPEPGGLFKLRFEGGVVSEGEYDGSAVVAIRVRTPDGNWEQAARQSN